MTMISSSVGRRGRASVRHFLCEGMCGFEGAFDAVVAHERTCPLAKARRPGAPLKDPAEYACEFSCGFKGRFEETLAHEKICPSRPDKGTWVGSFGPGARMLSAESSRAPDSQGLLPGARIVPQYACEFLCGFHGSFEDVSAHENACTARPGVDASAGAALGETVGFNATHGSGIPVGEQNLSASTLVRMFRCEFGCGFTGAFEGVQAHENECAMRPGKDLAHVKMKGNKTASPDPHGEREDPVAFRCQSGCGYIGTYDEVLQHEQLCVPVSCAATYGGSTRPAGEGGEGATEAAVWGRGAAEMVNETIVEESQLGTYLGDSTVSGALDHESGPDQHQTGAWGHQRIDPSPAESHAKLSPILRVEPRWNRRLART
jgi:hypothetical protein